MNTMETLSDRDAPVMLIFREVTFFHLTPHSPYFEHSKRSINAFHVEVIVISKQVFLYIWVENYTFSWHKWNFLSLVKRLFLSISDNLFVSLITFFFRKYFIGVLMKDIHYLCYCSVTNYESEL
jgi:hypothetical protein